MVPERTMCGNFGMTTYHIAVSVHLAVCTCYQAALLLKLAYG